MHEDLEYNIQVPPAELDAHIAHVRAGGDSATEDEMVDVRKIFSIAREIELVGTDICHQEVPQRYIILRMCNLVREALTKAPAILDQIEAKYISKSDTGETKV
jgi:hypothetical protein